MAINQAMCGSYKKEITAGIHFWMSHSRTGAVSIAFLDFADTTWASSTISSARCAMIYNSTLSTAGTGGDVTHAAYPTVAVLDFGGDKSSSAGDFTIQYPANDANNAVIRIA